MHLFVVILLFLLLLLLSFCGGGDGVSLLHCINVKEGAGLTHGTVLAQLQRESRSCPDHTHSMRPSSNK